MKQVLGKAIYFINHQFKDQTMNILIYKMLASVCVSIHADFSTMLSPFGEVWVSLEPDWQEDAGF